MSLNAVEWPYYDKFQDMEYKDGNAFLEQYNTAIEANDPRLLPDAVLLAHYFDHAYSTMRLPSDASIAEWEAELGGHFSYSDYRPSEVYDEEGNRIA